MNPASQKGLTVEVHNLAKEYADDSSTVVAISDLSFEIASGEQVCLVGRTGCGKSTLFRLLAGLESPSRGKVQVEGRDPVGDFAWFRGRLGVVYQEDRLLPWRSALSNAALGLEILKVARREREDRARDWLVRLGLGDFLRSYPGQLSGGMRQRVALARALAPRPQLILADEAFGHLDEVTGRQLRADFLEHARQAGTTVLLVTHNLNEAIESFSRVLVLGQPGWLLADLNVPAETAALSFEGLRSHLQEMLKHNKSLEA